MRRRRFLQALGLQTLGLQALGLGAGTLFLPSRRGFAQDAPPQRLLLFYTAQGCAPDRWRCDPFGHGDVNWDEDWTGWDAGALSDSLRPLHPWLRRCTAVSGLGLLSAQAEVLDQQHTLAVAHGLTGADAEWVDSFPYAGGPSVDQLVADAVSREDRFRSLECSVGEGLVYVGSNSETAIYRGPVQPIVPIDDPLALWDRLLGSVGARDPLAARRSGVLDLVAARHEELARQLSGEDRVRLDEHAQMIRELELRLEGLSAARCDDAPLREAFTQGLEYEDQLEAQLQLILSAFSCDLTRVASIQMGQLDPTALGLPPGEFHADYAHELYSSAEAEEAVVSYSAHHAGHLARILEALDAVPEAGGTLLDNTLVLWMSELADTWHAYDDYPVVLAGGEGTGLRAGRCVNYARTSPLASTGPRARETMGMPHQRLLVSVCQMMGLSTQAVGVEAITGADGSLIDCTGALPELLR